MKDDIGDRPADLCSGGVLSSLRVFFIFSASLQTLRAQCLYLVYAIGAALESEFASS
jgi:hypothetical protein